MIQHVSPRQLQSGFSLVEMAIVLAIVALLLGGLLPTISSQIEQQRRNETRKQLDEIQQALMGFAIINGRLPCPMPATITDPSNAGYGLEAASCPGNPAAEGYLPWKTLGVSETDAWGSRRTSTSSPWNGYWRYRVDRNYATTITMSTGGATGFGTCSPTPTSDCLAIQNTAGSSLTSASERPIAIVFSTGPDLIPNGQNANFVANGDTYQSDVPSPAFNDMLIWISRPQLFNRMVTAGKLP